MVSAMASFPKLPARIRSRSPDASRPSGVSDAARRSATQSVPRQRGDATVFQTSLDSVNQRVDSLAVTMQNLMVSQQQVVERMGVMMGALQQTMQATAQPSSPPRAMPMPPVGVQTPPGFQFASPPGFSPDVSNQQSSPGPEVPKAPSVLSGGTQQMEVDREGQAPIEKPKVWKGRMEEIIGFASYLIYLSNWLGNLSDKYPREMQLAIAQQHEIKQSTLAAGEAIRSIRLHSLLMQVFSDNAKALNLLMAYAEGVDNLEVCGYESLRRLHKEYSLFSRAEGYTFRNTLIGKTFKASSIVEMFNLFDLEMSRYNRLISTLPSVVDRASLAVTEADKSIIVLRSLPDKCREYTVLGDGIEDFNVLRQRALDWEYKHRAWSELDKTPNKIQELQQQIQALKGKGGKKGPGFDSSGKGSKGKSKDSSSKGSGGAGAGKGKVSGACYLCNKPGHIAKNCPEADKVAGREKAVCYKCGEVGHFMSKCPQNNKSSSQSNDKGKGKKGGSSGKGKGKKGMKELIENESESAQPAEEPSASGSPGHDSHEGSAAQSQQQMFLQMPFLSFGPDLESWNNGDDNLQCEGQLRSLTMQNFWLLDSGASAHVVRRQDVGRFKVLKRMKSQAKFSAAHGKEVIMDEQVTLQVAFCFKGSDAKQQQWVPIVLDAYVGDVQSNVLSVGSLSSKGWAFRVDASETSLTFQQFSGVVKWYANCPWLECQSDVSQTFQISDVRETLQPVIKSVPNPEEVHRLRGHMPPDPRNCVTCAQAHGVSISKRRKQVVMNQVQADFCHLKVGGKDRRALILAHGETGFIAAIHMGADQTATIHAIRDFCVSAGLVGPGPTLEIMTDAERQVGIVMRQVQPLLAGRHIIVQRAAPQEHQSIGLAEGAVRKAKQGIRVLELELEKCGYHLQPSDFVLQLFLNYYTSVHNRFSCNAFGRSPKSELFDKDMPTSQTAGFCHRVLAEVPESLGCVERWVESTYLHCNVNSQLGHRCRAIIRGKLVYFAARHIKVIEPSCIDHDVLDASIGDELLIPVKDQPLPEKMSGDEAEAEVAREPEESRVDPAVKPVVEYNGKSNPPIRFYRQHGWTDGCTACRYARDTGSAHANLHSKRCRDRYMDWLKNGGSHPVVPETDVVAPSQEYSPSIAPRDDPEIFQVDANESQPSNVASASSNGETKRFRLTEKSTPEKYYGVDRPSMDDVEMSANDISDIDVGMGLEDNISSILATLTHVNPLWDGSVGGFFCSHVFSEEGIIYPIKYDDSLREELKLCGTTVWQSIPTIVRDEGSQKLLDIGMTLKGIKREYQHMTEKCVGDCCDGNRARELSKEWNCKIIGTRWVLGQKYRHCEDGSVVEEVRARCVVQDVRDGTSAVMNGYSSPTTSIEALKVILAIAGRTGKAVLSADVSTAYMSNPLPEHIRAIIRLPSGTSFQDASPVYMVLRNALNGLRPAALAWVLYFRKIVNEAFGLRIGKAHDGSWVAVLTYVDDILFFAKDLEVCRAMLKRLQQSIEIKETGNIDVPSRGGGELSFLGRRFIRSPGENAILVAMTQEFNSGLSKMGPNLKTTDILSDVKPILESQDVAVLSAEKQTEFRSLVGRLLWMGPFRPDIAVALSMVSCGQAEPQQRHEKAAKALLKYCLGTVSFAQRFPVLVDEEYLFHAGDHAFSSLVTFSDASYAPMRSMQRKSVSGAVISFMGSIVKSFCRTQGAITLSSAEAELEALAAAVQESLGIFKLCGFAGGLSEHDDGQHTHFVDLDGKRAINAVVVTDSAAATAVLLREDVQRRLRHSEIKLEWLKQLSNENVIRYKWQSGLENPADALTKVVSRPLQLKYREMLGLVSLSEMELQSFLSSCCREIITNDLGKFQTSEEAGFVVNDGEKTDQEDEVFCEDIDVESGGAFIQSLTNKEMQSMNEMFSEWTFQQSHKFLLIEFCCDVESRLSDNWVKQGPEFQAWRVHCSAERAETIWRLCECLQRFVNSRGERKIWLHSSLPCTGGSLLLLRKEYFPGNRETHIFTRWMFKRLLGQLKAVVKVMVGLVSADRYIFTFELARTCSYWNWRCVHQIKQWFDTLMFSCILRLCQTKDGKLPHDGGLRKAWRVVSTSEELALSLQKKFGGCKCKHHALPGSYQLTAYYPQSLTRVWVSFVSDRFRGMKTNKEEIKDGPRLIWTK